MRKRAERSMTVNLNPSTESNKYLRLLSEKYPSVRAVTREIINL